jgi:hypothetical protein
MKTSDALNPSYDLNSQILNLLYQVLNLPADSSGYVRFVKKPIAGLSNHSTSPGKNQLSNRWRFKNSGL